MKYAYKLHPKEWVVMYCPRRDEIILGPKIGYQRFKDVWKQAGYFYVGKL